MKINISEIKIPRPFLESHPHEFKLAEKRRHPEFHLYSMEEDDKEIRIHLIIERDYGR